ncbi:MAG: preprotein translocase subunit YajC [Deltaproteobacteria bacterium]|nr:preprotein translocase subunit YajC [Deltaproteobacteria bacterium]
MWDVAYAQAGGGPSTFISMLPLVLIFAVFYFLLIRPQQRKAKDHRNMLAQLKRNDEVMTTGGVFGKILGITETEITLEVAPNVKIKVGRGYIAQLFRAEKTTGAKEAKGK